MYIYIPLTHKHTQNSGIALIPDLYSHTYTHIKKYSYSYTHTHNYIITYLGTHNTHMYISPSSMYSFHTHIYIYSIQPHTQTHADISHTILICTHKYELSHIIQCSKHMDTQVHI